MIMKYKKKNNNAELQNLTLKKKICTLRKIEKHIKKSLIHLINLKKRDHYNTNFIN